jgi:hypothetical protein
MKATEHNWVGSDRCEDVGEHERELIDRRADVEVLGEVQDADACYSYDDYALVRLDDAYYLLRTSGCSCPSPSETWAVHLGPTTLDAIEAHLRDNKTTGAAYGVTDRQFDEFVAMIASARAAAEGVAT